MGWTIGRVLTGVLKLGLGRRIDLSEHEEIPKDVLEEMEKEKQNKEG